MPPFLPAAPSESEPLSSPEQPRNNRRPSPSRGQARRQGGAGRRDRAPEALGNGQAPVEETPVVTDAVITEGAEGTPASNTTPEGAALSEQENQNRRRRRGRRGGRRRHGGEGENPVPAGGEQQPQNAPRPPREGGGRWRQDTLATLPAPQAPIPTLPTSIHEIDTTPRPVSPASAQNVSHETENATPENPKGGWWRRLTGQ